MTTENGQGWTPGGWVYSKANWRGVIDPKDHRLYISGNITDEGSTAVCVVEGNATSTKTTHANAHRIINCVNACASIPTDALAGGVVPRGVLDVSDEDMPNVIELVEEEVGSGCGAWDMVDAAVIIRAVVTVLTRHRQPTPGGETGGG